MNRKILNWHAKNMDVVIDKTAYKPDTALLWAVAVAVKWILTEMERKESHDRDSKRTLQAP